MSSNDSEALDRMERLIQALSAAAPPKTKWTVYYLRLADATETATMLGSLFPDVTVAQSTSTTTGRSLFGGFNGFRTNTTDDSGLGSLSKGGKLRIIPELRSNALFISGPEDEVNQVMEALGVLDSAELPESLKDRVPRLIDIQHADVTDVAGIVRDVYKEHMDAGTAGQQGGQQNSNRGGGFNPMAMFMGGGQQQQNGARTPRAVQLSIGVDTRTNTLIVSASDPLFRQVESLVKSLDESASQARRTVKVVSLQNANSSVVQQTLGSLLGKVRTNAPRSGGPEKQGATTPAAAPATTTEAATPEVDPTAQFMQQRMMQRMMQGGGGGRWGRQGGN
jgi:type II secretory pathway component GspD/PulD (secretin)